MKTKLIVSTVIVGLATMVYTARQREHQAVDIAREAVSRLAHQRPMLLGVSLHSDGVRHGHEVVPGGIHDFPLAFKTYPQLDRANTGVGVLQWDVYAYVSYRGDDGKIHWTTKRRLIPKGTAIISDGTIWILMRCGNQILFDPPSDPSTEATPPADIFPYTPSQPDTVPPVVSSPADPSLPITPGIVQPPQPSASVPTIPGPPTIPTPNVTPPIITPCCSVPPVNTPEPSTWALLGGGLLLLLISLRLWGPRRD